MLDKQVVNEEHIKHILDHEFDKRVQSFWFWGDAWDALRDTDLIPYDDYSRMQQHGLINWHLQFGKLPSKTHKETFAKFRRCDYQSQQTDYAKL